MSFKQIFFSFLTFFIIQTISGSAQTDTTRLVFPNDTIHIKQIIITGNKTTRSSIIRRELVFHEGDTFTVAVLEKTIERTRENLMNTVLFNFVTITWQKTTEKDILIIVDLAERWYIFPVPVFELVDRNFNEWVRSGDWTRINYGFYLNWNNFRGLNESVRFHFRWGYSQRIGISYSIPYINKNQKEGLSFSASYSRNREILYDISESKQLLYQDKDNFVRREMYYGLRYTRRSEFYNTNSFSIEYRYNTIADSVALKNPDYLGDGETTQELIALSWQFRRDRRDYKIYPLKGYLLELDAVKNGLGILRNEPNLMLLSSQFKYFHPLSKRWYAAASIKGKLAGQSEAPYFNQRGLGFGNEFVRGYEYYVVPGQNYFLGKTTLKFALLPTQVIILPFIPLEKFRTIPYALYLNANFDAAWVRDRQFFEKNPLANEWLYGYGVGVDYVSYYNLVLRFEYSLNKFGEDGFFLHFSAPI